MRRVGLVLLVVLLAFGCSPNGPQTETTACDDPRGDTAFPVEAVQDRVTYGDHLVPAKVELAADYGWVDLIPENTLWSRPAAQLPPEQVRAWSNGDQASPERIDLLQPHIHLVMLVRRHGDGQEPSWSAMDVLAFDDGVVEHGPKQCWPAGKRPAREELWGLHAADVRQPLTTAQPDSLAAPYADLDPGERYQRVAAQRR